MQDKKKRNTGPPMFIHIFIHIASGDFMIRCWYKYVSDMLTAEHKLNFSFDKTMGIKFICKYV